MEGINLNYPIRYLYSSMRYFKKGEYHIERVFKEDVLLIVVEGILRFEEDGVEYEVKEGEYHIQKRNSVQRGVLPSDAPKYLFIHFLGEWGPVSEKYLPKRGTFNYESFESLIKKMDEWAHSDRPYIEQSEVFYRLLSYLYRKNSYKTIADDMAVYLERYIEQPFSLQVLCERFHFSKNHIINLFRERFSMTPVEYLNGLRIRKAKHLLEATADSAENVAQAVGFNHYSHFYRLFLRQTGQTPREWRRLNQLYPNKQ